MYYLIMRFIALYIIIIAGPAILRMLQYALNKEVFQEGINIYLERQ